MDKSKPTLAIYGIQDRFDNGYPGYVHDHNLTIAENGRIKKFLQLERITRKKRDNTLYSSITDILRKEKLIKPGEHDLVFVDNVVGRAFISSDGNARFEAPLNNKLTAYAEKGRCWWYDKDVDGWVVNHEMAHIFTCLPFFGNFRENSLLVHFDGGASLSNFSAWVYREGKITPVEYHWKLKKITSLFNANPLSFAILGEKMNNQNSVPGKMMGFASYGKYSAELEKWLDENNYFENIWGRTDSFISKAKSDLGVLIKGLSQKDPFIQDIIATMQYIFTRETVQALKRLREETGCETLYYSGGCALNIVTNSKIVDEKIFENVFIPPCCEDSGLSLGAASFAEWIKHGEVRKHSPYLNNWGIEECKTEYSTEDIKQVAELINEGKVIGVCNGYGESGPRALGNRSIISHPCSSSLAMKVSMEHKKREWYRPVAPVMLKKNASYFTGKESINPLAEYMLLDFEVLMKRQKEIEGVVHVNRTSRIQTISSRSQNPFIYDLLEYLDRQFGYKALINTSFNQNGKPIVHTEEDAMKTALEMKLDGVVINGKLIILCPQS